MSFEIGSIGVIIVAIGILVYLYLRKRNDEKGKEEIQKFLNSLQEDFEAIILKAIDAFDITKIDNLALLEQEIINSLIEILWHKAISALEDYVVDPFNKALIQKFLTKEYIIEFTKKIFEETTKIQMKYTAKYNDAIVEANREAILLEAGVVQKNKEIENDDPIDFRHVDDIDPNMIIDAEGKVVEQVLNPPVDEEPIEITGEDNSIEILETEE